MKIINCQVAAGIGVSALLLVCAAPGSSKVVPDGQLSPDQIFQKARENYAILSSYSDQGQNTIKVNGATTITPFTIKLSRPDCYLIEWHPQIDLSPVIPSDRVQAVWSSGAGGFLEAGHGPKCEGSLSITLDKAASPSGGAAATIPMMFFNIEPGNELGHSVYEEHQQSDDQVGTVPCYVFTRQSQGLTRTLWIGKPDFLIHQARTVISAEAMQAATVKLTQGRPRMLAFLHAYTATETHTNIVVNKPIPNSMFMPSIQHFAADNEND